jgi:hypothetical protein
MSKDHGVRVLVGLKNNGEDDNGNTKVREALYNMFFQKTSQSDSSALNGFKTFITCSKVRKNVEDAKQRRAPKMEYFSYEPEIHYIEDAKSLVMSSVDEADSDDTYTQSEDDTF